MRGREAHAAQARDRVEAPQQAGEGRTALGRGRSLPKALTFWPSRVTSSTPSATRARTSASTASRGPAALRAARRGHDAVGADVGAAAHDLDPGLERPLAVRGQLAGERGPSVEEARRCRPAATRRRGSSGSGAGSAARGRTSTNGKRSKKRLAFDLRQAAGDHHDAARVERLDPGGLAEVAGQAVVGALAHRAGVVDEHVGVVDGSSTRSQAVALEQGADALRVVIVHLTAERPQVVVRMTLRVGRRAAYFASSTARLSRITVTLIWPG